MFHVKPSDYFHTQNQKNILILVFPLGVISCFSFHFLQLGTPILSVFCCRIIESTVVVSTRVALHHRHNVYALHELIAELWWVGSVLIKEERKYTDVMAAVSSKTSNLMAFQMQFAGLSRHTAGLIGSSDGSLTFTSYDGVYIQVRIDSLLIFTEKVPRF